MKKKNYELEIANIIIAILSVFALFGAGYIIEAVLINSYFWKWIVGLVVIFFIGFSWLYIAYITDTSYHQSHNRR